MGLALAGLNGSWENSTLPWVLRGTRNKSNVRTVCVQSTYVLVTFRFPSEGDMTFRYVSKS